MLQNTRRVHAGNQDCARSLARKVALVVFLCVVTKTPVQMRMQQKTCLSLGQRTKILRRRVRWNEPASKDRNHPNKKGGNML